MSGNIGQVRGGTPVVPAPLSSPTNSEPYTLNPNDPNIFSFDPAGTPQYDGYQQPQPQVGGSKGGGAPLSAGPVTGAPSSITAQPVASHIPADRSPWAIPVQMAAGAKDTAGSKGTAQPTQG